MSPPKNPWDKVFKEHGAFFEEPHEDMEHIVLFLAGKRSRRVLDLGCGSGRHVVYFARNRFSVYGLDSSPEGIKMTRAWLRKEGLRELFKDFEITDIHLDSGEHYSLLGIKP